MWLDYFVTANPILLKTRLLEKFFEGHRKAFVIRRRVLKLREKEDRKVLNAVIGKLMELLEPYLSCWDVSPSDELDLSKKKAVIREEIERALRRRASCGFSLVDREGDMGAILLRCWRTPGGLSRNAPNPPLWNG